MNRLHKWYCSRENWKRHVREDLVPAAIDGVELGNDVLEVGPGYGPATEVLSGRADRVTALELDPVLAAELQRRIGSGATIVEGDATDMPFADGSFSGATCFTMLHHIPSADMQDRMIAEVHRTLAPGGSFAGTDSFAGGLAFKLAHVGDVNTPIDPDTLGARLEHAGFGEVEIDVGPGVAAQTVFFRARSKLRVGFESRPG